MAIFKKVFATADGKMFDSAAEADAHVRGPLIKEALLAVAGGQQELADFLLKNQEEFESALETGTIRRVTKAERAKIKAAFEHLVTLDDSKLNFIKENAEGFVDSFRWPAVKRLKEEEKTAMIKSAFMKLADENFANWAVLNQAAVLAAYNAGKEKREVSQKAKDGLAEYQAQRKAAKELKEFQEAKAKALQDAMAAKAADTTAPAEPAPTTV
jgi:hypothetical protein